jgi:hypothetical protein
MNPPRSAIRLKVIAGSRPAFEFPPGVQAPRVLFLQVVPEGESEPLWAVGPVGSFVGRSVATHLHGPVAANATEVVDQAFSRTVQEFGVVAQRFEFGVVPEGFQQLIPEVGEPQALEAGRSYSVQVVGETLVQEAFVA